MTKYTGYKPNTAVIILAGLLLMWLTCGQVGAITYATITSINPSQMSNGVQIVIKADGVLEFDQSEGWGRTTKIKLDFPGARSSVPNFIDVSNYPVSHIQTSVPQDAQEGVGVELTVSLFVPSTCRVDHSEDRQSVIITVDSDRTLEKSKTEESTSVAEQKTHLTCDYKDGLISINAVKADMLKVFGIISEKSGVNIVVDDSLAGRIVSMSLEGMEPKTLFETIANAYGLALGQQGDVYMVSEGEPTDLATYRLSSTASFPMQYVQAQTASGLLPTFLYKYLHVNSEQNAVVVSAPKQMLDKIEKDLSKVDLAPPQIMVEAIAIETSSEEDTNAVLDIIAQGSHAQFSSNSESGEVSYTTVGMLPSDFQAELKALVSANKAKINAAPRMAVINGHDASIFIGAQRFIRVKYTNYGQEIEQVQGIDVGIKLTVTPWTGSNDEITTKITPEVSNILELDRQTGLPVLSSRKASTTVRVKSGETVVIGGLNQSQDYITKRKVPILGDLPLVGGLFQSRSKTKINSDLIILITPRILDDTGHLPAAEEEGILDRMLGTQNGGTE